LGILVANACEAMGPEGGRLRLSIGICTAVEIPTRSSYPIGWQPQGPEFAFLAVEDNGCGIAGADVEKLFDPFYSSKSVGRGLGLPVVLGLIQAHGGIITVVSQQGQGSVFRVLIPVYTETQPATPDLALHVFKPMGGRTILLVDDDEILLEATGPLIEWLGFKVLTAQDGVEAIEVFHRYRAEICCVLTDLTMPRMNGLDLLNALHQLDPNLPVILASGYDMAHALPTTHVNRPQAFLNKPFRLQQLRDALGRVLGEV
jgi:CheY-like chemotaxis protein